VYDPAGFNDRLLLGLKGTMSEAELHILKARMLEGRRAKARRGELGKPVPMGYVRRLSGEVALDPDEQAQSTIRQVFTLFERFRTIGKVLCYLVEHDIRMPVRTPGGPGKGELEWRRASRPSLHNLFGNPIYAGIYAYGVRATDRRRQKPGRPGTGRDRTRTGLAGGLAGPAGLRCRLPPMAGQAVRLPGLPVADRCLVMGVVNVTPDSFSDGGLWFCAQDAIDHGLALVASGADIVDESNRKQISAERNGSPTIWISAAVCQPRLLTRRPRM